ncbi:hypothetical protein AGMMS49940_14230 [Spirochaetia bacterium]|nr:hypothetical protein AGMMS49940_14230 [Spirochaetia bacterium]
MYGALDRADEFFTGSTYGGSNIIPFPIYGSRRANTNLYSPPIVNSQNMDEYINTLVYEILYREKILPHLSTNNSFDPILFKDLPTDTVDNHDAKLLFAMSRQIEDLSSLVDFD